MIRNISVSDTFKDTNRVAKKNTYDNQTKKIITNIYNLYYLFI